MANAPELVRAYNSMCDYAGISEEKRPKLVYHQTNDVGFAWCYRDENAIKIAGYAYDKFSIAAWISGLAHELGHAEFKEYDALMARAKDEPRSILKEYLGWDDAQIEREAHDYAKGKMEGIHKKRLEKTNKDSPPEVIAVLKSDVSVTPWQIKATEKELAERVVAALDEIAADSYAQVLLGGEWARKFDEELEVLYKKKTFPLRHHWVYESEREITGRGLDRKSSTWWLINAHPSDPVRFVYMDAAERIAEVDKAEEKRWQNLTSKKKLNSPEASVSSRS